MLGRLGKNEITTFMLVIVDKRSSRKINHVLSLNNNLQCNLSISWVVHHNRKQGYGEMRLTQWNVRLEDLSKVINLLGYIRLSFLKCSFFIIYFFQLCHNGSALPCPPNTYVKCNETVSLAHCIKWYQSKWSPSLTRGVLRASPYPLK